MLESNVEKSREAASLRPSVLSAAKATLRCSA